MNVYDCLFIKPSELFIFPSDGSLDLCSQHTPTVLHKSSDAFECTQKIIYLNQGKPKTYLLNFPTPKNYPRMENLQPLEIRTAIIPYTL